jgi:N-acetylmuramoyl-L-alanine amidase
VEDLPSELANRLVIIDVGHYKGGSIDEDEDDYQYGNAGARNGEDNIIGTSMSELEFNQQMGNLIRSELNSLINSSGEDIQVVLTSDSIFYTSATKNNTSATANDNQMSRSERATEVKDYADAGKEVLAYVSLHGNDAPNNASVNGSEIFYIGDSSLANALSNPVQSSMGTNTVAVRDGSGIGGVRLAMDTGTSVPNALIEFGYISNPEDNALMSDSDKRKIVAETVAQAIFDYIK